MKNTVIFGGTFNPIHSGHIEIIRNVLALPNTEKVIVMPTAVPPHKVSDNLACDADRFEMCKLACSNMKNVEVSDLELLRGGKSYTYDTLSMLAGDDKRLFLLCGTDMVLSFDRWYKYEEILKMCYPTYVRRERDKILETRIIEKITEYYNKHGVMFRRILTDPIEVSSTEIRALVSAGKSISHIVPPAVEKYIKEKRLYE
jgi:nicotinate-nucleotide adenylyltransferase